MCPIYNISHLRIPEQFTSFEELNLAALLEERKKQRHYNYKSPVKVAQEIRRKDSLDTVQGSLHTSQNFGINNLQNYYIIKLFCISCTVHLLNKGQHKILEDHFMLLASFHVRVCLGRAMAEAREGLQNKELSTKTSYRNRKKR